MSDASFRRNQAERWHRRELLDWVYHQVVFTLLVIVALVMLVSAILAALVVRLMPYIVAAFAAILVARVSGVL